MPRSSFLPPYPNCLFSNTHRRAERVTEPMAAAISRARLLCRCTHRTYLEKATTTQVYKRHRRCAAQGEALPSTQRQSFHARPLASKGRPDSFELQSVDDQS